MTFTEAALAVLQQEGRPMHSREIAEKAVERGLLSHVGKTPVQTMSARLSAAVSKGNEKGAFARVRPGVFALSAWSGKSPGKPAAGPPTVKEAAKTDSAPPAPAASTSAPGEAAQPRKKKRRRRKKRAVLEGDSNGPVAVQPAAHQTTQPKAQPAPRQAPRPKAQPALQAAAGPEISKTKPD
jgi:hypothetical protein